MSIDKYIRKIIRKNNEIVYLKQQRDLLKENINHILDSVDKDIRKHLEKALDEVE